MAFFATVHFNLFLSSIISINFMFLNRGILIESVSYTHLDVYKRQVQCRSNLVSSDSAGTNIVGRLISSFVRFISRSSVMLDSGGSECHIYRIEIYK